MLIEYYAYMVRSSTQYVCPKNKTPLTPLSPDHVKDLNAKIACGAVRDITGELVVDQLSGAFYCAHSELIYQIRCDIPILFYAEAISLTGLQASPEDVTKQDPGKLVGELAFWIGLRREVDNLFLRGEPRYKNFMTNHLNFDLKNFDGKRVLDIGCGPQGSLEGLPNATIRVGIDPLAFSYRQLGNWNHDMDYVCGQAEQMPFEDGYFDIVSSMNSLDHVDDISPVIEEIMRVLTPGGYFLLFTETHAVPTVCEPTVFSWDILEQFTQLKVLYTKHTEKSQWDTPYDHNDPTERHGSLFSVLQKQEELSS